MLMAAVKAVPVSATGGCTMGTKVSVKSGAPRARTAGKCENAGRLRGVPQGVHAGGSREWLRGCRQRGRREGARSPQQCRPERASWWARNAPGLKEVACGQPVDGVERTGERRNLLRSVLKRRHVCMSLTTPAEEQVAPQAWTLQAHWWPHLSCARPFCCLARACVANDCKRLHECIVFDRNIRQDNCVLRLLENNGPRLQYVLQSCVSRIREIHPQEGLSQVVLSGTPRGRRRSG